MVYKHTCSGRVASTPLPLPAMPTFLARRSDMFFRSLKHHSRENMKTSPSGDLEMRSSLSTKVVSNLRSTSLDSETASL